MSAIHSLLTLCMTKQSNTIIIIIVVDYALLEINGFILKTDLYYAVFSYHDIIIFINLAYLMK
jgi:hypothetical protein